MMNGKDLIEPIVSGDENIGFCSIFFFFFAVDLHKIVNGNV
jgi:hypothetical protein